MSARHRKRKLKIPSFAKWGFAVGYIIYLVAPWVLAAAKKPTVNPESIASISRAFQASPRTASPEAPSQPDIPHPNSDLLSTHTPRQNFPNPPLAVHSPNEQPTAPRMEIVMDSSSPGQILDHFQDATTYQAKDAVLTTVEESCLEGCSEETRFALFSVITQLKMIGGSEERDLARRAVGILRAHSPRSETIDDLARSL